MPLTNSRFQQKTNCRYAGFIACVFAFIFALACYPVSAWADVRSDDVVLGQTVQSRSLKASDCPSIGANYAYVVSSDGTVYYDRGAQTETKIASVTKVMTAVVALQYGDPEQTQITVSENAASIGESSAALMAGDTLVLRDALKALMICSGNDAAQAIAESMGSAIRDELKESGDSDVPDNAYDAFIYAMNKKAAELGMTNSKFANPHGLDFDKYAGDMHSTAHDVSLMCIEAMKSSLFRSIVSTDTETIQVTRAGASADVLLESTDELLGVYNGACGIKTGYTELAGSCFAGAVERNGEILYAIVLDSSDDVARFTDCTTLTDWVYNNTIQYPLAHSTETVNAELNGEQKDVPVVAEVSHKGWIDKTFKATLANPDERIEVFRLEGNVSQEMHFDDVTSDVSPGQKVGTVEFKQDNKVIKTVDLVAAEECKAPNFFEGIGIWWDRLFRGFNNEPTEAESTVVNTTPLIYGRNATVETN